MIDDPEEFAWQQLEAKQNKAKSTPITDRLALQVAHNALSAIDRETPYPIAKHALMLINEVMSRPVQDWEAIAGDQAMTIAMLQSDIEHSLARVANALDIADRAYFAGKKDGIDETLAQPWDTSDMAHRFGALTVKKSIKGQE